MTLVITIKASDNAKNRYRARRAAKREQQQRDEMLARRIATAAAGCSARVQKAISANVSKISWQPSADNRCLPQVALYAAGFRKPTETLTAR